MKKLLLSTIVAMYAMIGTAHASDYTKDIFEHMIAADNDPVELLYVLDRCAGLYGATYGAIAKDTRPSRKEAIKLTENALNTFIKLAALAAASLPNTGTFEDRILPHVVKYGKIMETGRIDENSIFAGQSGRDFLLCSDIFKGFEENKKFKGNKK